MLRRLFIGEFHAEVVNDQGECDTIAFVPKEACSGGLMVSVGSQVCDKRVLRDLSSMRETVQAFDHFEQDSAIMSILM